MDINRNEIKLIEPCIELKDEFLAMVEEYWATGEQNGGWMLAKNMEDFASLLKKSKDYSQGKNLPESWVPSTNSWLVDGTEVIGYSSLRHDLNEGMKKRGGHIDYYIRPCKRGKGYSSLMLSLMLDQARGLGLKKVLVTCDEDNIASVRIIEKNGDKFQDKVEVEIRRR